jgi:hypothetical protein
MGQIVERLKGSKTYIQAALAAVVVGLSFVGTIDREMAGVILTLLGAGSVASLGAKIDRANGK